MQRCVKIPIFVCSYSRCQMPLGGARTTQWPPFPGESLPAFQRSRLRAIFHWSQPDEIKNSLASHENRKMKTALLGRTTKGRSKLIMDCILDGEWMNARRENKNRWKVVSVCFDERQAPKISLIGLGRCREKNLMFHLKQTSIKQDSHRIDN